MVLVHGWESARHRTLPNAQFLHALGYHVLTVDVRGHGENPAETLPVSAGEFGADALAGVGAALDDPRVTQVAILGHSMGSIGAILAAAAEPRVAAVVLTATPADPYRLTRQTFKLAHLPIPDPIAYPLAWITTRVYLEPRRHSVGRDLGADAIRRYKGPILAIHGTDDRVVPFGHLGHLLKAVSCRPPGREPDADSAVEELVDPGRQHSWLYEFPAYRSAIGRFLAESLAGPARAGRSRPRRRSGRRPAPIRARLRVHGDLAGRARHRGRGERRDRSRAGHRIADLTMDIDAGNRRPSGRTTVPGPAARASPTRCHPECRPSSVQLEEQPALGLHRRHRSRPPRGAGIAGPVRRAHCGGRGGRRAGHAGPARSRQPLSVLWDLGLASQNMILTAWSRGIGSCPATVYDHDLARRLLGYPEGMTCEYLLSFGLSRRSGRLTRPLKPGGRRPLTTSSIGSAGRNAGRGDPRARQFRITSSGRTGRKSRSSRTRNPTQHGEADPQR